ncbi:MAG: hypothetical protein EZS28_045272, partial [Streblomastix strix]
MRFLNNHESIFDYYVALNGKQTADFKGVAYIKMIVQLSKFRICGHKVGET